MVATNLLPVYLAPSVLALLFVVIGRTLSFHHFGALWRLPKRVTSYDWLAVYGYLGANLESDNGPRETKPVRPWRLIGAGISCLVSAFLLFVPLPLLLPISFAQSSWNVFPLNQVVVAGGALALSLVLAFHRPKGWLLHSNPPAEYPYLGWATVKTALTKEGEK
jgi:hypothetical protein